MSHSDALIFTHTDRARVLQKNPPTDERDTYSITVMNPNLTDGYEIPLPSEFPLSDETLVSIAQDYLDSLPTESTATTLFEPMDHLISDVTQHSRVARGGHVRTGD